VSRRTTLTLDDDVADRLVREARRLGKPFRDVVNASLRRGLASGASDAPFRVDAKDLRRRPGVEIDDVEGLIDLLDGSTRR
jgi:hypothetical protein